jgi:N-acetyl-beta-hexosaminidase
MEPTKRKAASGPWDRIPEEIISLIIIKVVETSEAPLEDLHSLRLCNKETKRASSSHAIANHFNLEHHYPSTDWNPEEYLQTIDWLQGANNGQALFVKRLADLCTARPSGASLLARAEEEGDFQASYVLAIIMYYKHDITDDVFNHIRHVYRACDEDEARVLGVHKQVSDEIH